MSRAVSALVSEIVLAILVALGLGSLVRWFFGGGDLPAAAAAAEAARRLFFFMDIGLAVWAVVLVVLAVRRRALPGIGVTLLAAAVGVVANALTVVVVSLVQGAGTAEFLGFAIEAGAVFLIAVLVVAPIIHRLFRPGVKPPG
jgi:hypothetical protein